MHDTALAFLIKHWNNCFHRKTVILTKHKQNKKHSKTSEGYNNAVKSAEYALEVWL